MKCHETSDRPLGRVSQPQVDGLELEPSNLNHLATVQDRLGFASWAAIARGMMLVLASARSITCRQYHAISCSCMLTGDRVGGLLLIQLR